MPRTRKTQNGKPAMPLASIPGQQYGAGVEQQQLQQAMPTPRDPVRKAIATAMPTSSAPPAERQSVDPMALAAALRSKVGLLNPASTRPNEPLTAGLSTGPGAGPESLGMQIRSPLGETMRMIARQSGDQFFAQLADRMNL